MEFESFPKISDEALETNQALEKKSVCLFFKDHALQSACTLKADKTASSLHQTYPTGPKLGDCH